MIDLHTHSTASDGKLTPAELMRHAKAVGIDVISLTDHDTLSGLAQASEEAARIGILPFHPDSGRYDRPDRLWRGDLGPELWLKSGVAELFSHEPSTRPAILRAYVDGRTAITAVLQHAFPPGGLLPGSFRLQDAAGLWCSDPLR